MKDLRPPGSRPASELEDVATVAQCPPMRPIPRPGADDPALAHGSALSEPGLSYFLHRMQDVWRWRIVDEVGEVVASGAAEDYARADADALAALLGGKPAEPRLMSGDS